jgi:hypothetical protein
MPVTFSVQVISLSPGSKMGKSPSIRPFMFISL